jgi:excisionase family DNA binding protein
MQETYPTPLAWQIDPACHRAGIGRTKMYQLIKEGEINTFKVGRRTLIPESELQKWLVQKMQGAK